MSPLLDDVISLAGISLRCRGTFPDQFKKNLVSPWASGKNSRGDFWYLPFHHRLPGWFLRTCPDWINLPILLQFLRQGTSPRWKNANRGALFRWKAWLFESYRGYAILRHPQRNFLLCCRLGPRGTEILPHLLRACFRTQFARSPVHLFCHGLGILHRGYAYLFLGKSGSGKSTLARTWPSSLLLSDENVALERRGRGWWAHATPWCHPRFQPRRPRSAPLAALFLLRPGPRLSLRRIEGRSVRGGKRTARIVSALLRNQQHYWPPASPLTRPKVLHLASCLPCYRLGFPRNAMIAEILELVS